MTPWLTPLEIVVGVLIGLCSLALILAGAGVVWFVVNVTRQGDYEYEDTDE
jgi:hypothetical protein